MGLWSGFLRSPAEEEPRPEFDVDQSCVALADIGIALSQEEQIGLDPMPCLEAQIVKVVEIRDGKAGEVGLLLVLVGKERSFEAEKANVV